MQQITDEYIINKFFSKQNQIICTRIKKASEEEIDYIINRFKEKSRSIKEALFRIKLNIEEIPKCPICGKLCKFENRLKRPYHKTCSTECGYKLSIINSQETKLKIYGHSNWSNWEKTKQTCLEKYGGQGFGSTILSEKRKKTCLEKYGDENYLNKEKSKQTCLEKYGVDNPAKSEIIKTKIKNTCIDKYGGNAPACSKDVMDKMNKTCIQRYGVKSYFMTKECIEKMRSEETRNKANETKRKNGTFNTSKTENISWEIIKEKFPNTKRNFKDINRYPFNCDFYIPEIDMFIECQYHWTHGGHPYNENDVNDIDKAKDWENSESKYKNNAYHTWVIRDTNKRKIAKDNNLNYIEVWTLSEFKKIINNL